MTSRTPHAALTFADFLKTPPGHLLARWTLQRFDLAVDRVFGAGGASDRRAAVGYAARQPDAGGMRSSLAATKRRSCATGRCRPSRTDASWANPSACPSPPGRSTLVTMPYALDFSASPQQVFARRLVFWRPKGASFFRLQSGGAFVDAPTRDAACGGRPYLPTKMLPIPLPRLRDWFALLGLEIDRGAFRIYVPGFRHAGALATLELDGQGWRPLGASLLQPDASRGREARTRRHPHRQSLPLDAEGAAGKMPVPTAGMNASRRRVRNPPRTPPTHHERADMTEPQQPTPLLIWTDGACKGNPGDGGWGALLQWKGHTLELFNGARETTNNKMELQAVISALRSRQPAGADRHPHGQQLREGRHHEVDSRLEAQPLADRREKSPSRTLIFGKPWTISSPGTRSPGCG